MRKLFYAMSMLLTMALVWTGCSDPEPTTVEKFTVTFDSQGGSAVSSLEINKGAKITEPTKPTNGDFIFAGWFKEAALTTEWNFSSDVVTAALTLYAKWTTVEYTVTFETNGGSAIEPVKVAEGATFKAPLPPSKKDEAFDGWFKEVALTTEWGFNSDKVTADVTLYAKWSDITRETLEELASEADAVNWGNYTRESYSAMIVKKDAARAVINDAGSTSAQVVTAYTELQAAIDALVALPVREVASIELEKTTIVDGFIYVNPGRYCGINAYAADAEGYSATDSRVEFDYDEVKLAAWAEKGIDVNGNNLNFMVKAALTAGETIEITIKSASKPAVFMTVTLKVTAVGEMKTKYIETVTSLPEPDKISYDDWEAIDKASNLYSSLSYDEREEEAVIAAYEKFQKCERALWDLPERIYYSFSGNVCTFTWKDFGEFVTEKRVFAATIGKAFPQGTYTTPDWDDDEKGDGASYQYRMKFTTEKEGVEQERTAEDANGLNATEWENTGTFTYECTGNQKDGGMFTLTHPKNAGGFDQIR